MLNRGSVSTPSYLRRKCMKFLKEPCAWLRRLLSGLVSALLLFSVITLLHAVYIAMHYSFQGTVLLLALLLIFVMIYDWTCSLAKRHRKPYKSEEEIKDSFKDVTGYSKAMTKCLLFLYLGLLVANTYMTFVFSKPSHEHWVTSIEKFNEDEEIISTGDIWLVECLPAYQQKSLIIAIDSVNALTELKDNVEEIDAETYQQYTQKGIQLLDSYSYLRLIIILMWLVAGAVKCKVDRSLLYHTTLKEFRVKNDSDSISK